MNIRRFTARTSRDALVLARQALGEDAVVLSTKPSAEGVEVLAMAPEGLQQAERMTPKAAPAPAPAPSAKAPAASNRQEPSFGGRDDTTEDVARLSMSTLSFQDYVRERMLRRRQDALKAEKGGSEPAPAAPAPARAAAAESRQRATDPRHAAGPTLHDEPPVDDPSTRGWPQTPSPALSAREAADAEASERLADRLAFGESGSGRASASATGYASSRAAEPAPMPVQAPSQPPSAPAYAAPAAAEPRQDDMMAELRSMKDLIEERFGALAYIEKLNRQPGQVRLIQKLLGCGFSPALIKRIGDSLPMDIADETVWAAGVLERNLQTAEAEPALEDIGGVYALVGATGVGKTTTTAKIAAAFAAKYGAANLGLITLDAYRIGAHEQLRAYGRILGVPVHTAHDRASLEDLLELLANKKMVLIDTAGMAQRDTRTKELLEMVSHRSIKKLLVINAASQGETIEDVMIAYQAPACAGLVLSKMDEAVKLGPALDAAIRMKLKVIGVANGQRVPEDWHRLGANALVMRALRAGGSSAYRLDANDVSLVFTTPVAAAAAPVRAAARA